MKNTLRKIRATIVKFIYNNPSKEMVLIGITGTDGKTTTSEMIYNILLSSKKNAGIVSTLGTNMINRDFQSFTEIDTGLHTTTPPTIDLYKYLFKMKREGVKYCVLELSSHSLSQLRPFGLKLKVAVFTNITHEHLDFHKTFENYRNDKCKLIDMVEENGFVIINKSDPNYKFICDYALKQRKKLNIVLYQTIYDDGKNRTNEEAYTTYQAFNIKKQEEGYTFDIKLKNLQFSTGINMNGEYNIQNAMAALSAGMALNLPVGGIIQGLAKTTYLKGRMNIIQKKPFKVIVDFAATPNGILNVLQYLKQELINGRLIAMFGCPSQRDDSKREPMGKNASIYADIIVLTSEDPRNESFENIIKDIMKGIDQNKFTLNNNLYIIESREEAIKFALTKIAKEGDIIALLGKGHEKSNNIKGIEYPWDEEQIALKYINQEYLN